MEILEKVGGGTVTRLSGWLDIDWMDVPHGHEWACYAEVLELVDEQDVAGCVYFFEFNGKQWAINQFVLLKTLLMGGEWIDIIESDGTITRLHAYDSENYYNPLIIEVDEYGTQVRVYVEN